MRHDRTPGDLDDDFLVDPDPSIGPILSASTNKTKRGWHPLTSQQKNVRTALCVVLGIVLGVLGALLGSGFHEVLFSLGLFFLADLQWLFALAFGVGGLVVGIVVPVILAALSRRAQASWVGKHGMMRYTRGSAMPAGLRSGCGAATYSEPSARTGASICSP